MISSRHVIDFHSHVLPEVDHGSDSLETSVFQLECARRCGVLKIIATPHFYPHLHNVEDFLQKRNDAYVRLKPHLSNIKVKLGAEVLLCPGLENMPGLENLFVYNTKTLLLELPFGRLTDEHFESVSAMVERGIDVILAHPDRYSVDTIDSMLALGVRLQLNATSLLGFKKNKKAILRWLEDGKVASVGSDIHGRDAAAYKRLLRCVKKLRSNTDSVMRESNIIWNNASNYKANPTR